MRQILIERARARGALKRGGGQPRVTLDEALLRRPTARRIDLLALDEALERLAALDADQARLVELRFFGGLTIEETAEAMGISAATVKRHWTRGARVARPGAGGEAPRRESLALARRQSALSRRCSSVRPPNASERLARDRGGRRGARAREVRALLASHERAGGFLEAPAWAAASGAAAGRSTPPLDRPADRQLPHHRGDRTRRHGRRLRRRGRSGWAGRSRSRRCHPPTRATPRAARGSRARPAPRRRSRIRRSPRSTRSKKSTDELFIVGELVRGRTLRAGAGRRRAAARRGSCRRCSTSPARSTRRTASASSIAT